MNCVQRFSRSQCRETDTAQLRETFLQLLWPTLQNTRNEQSKGKGNGKFHPGRCTCEIKSRMAMAKAAFNKKKTLFTRTSELDLRKKLVKCYIWSMALYGAENWTLRAADQKHLESFEVWWWRRMEKICWTDHVRNEEVLLRVNEQRNILHEIKNGRLTGLVTSYVETAF